MTPQICKLNPSLALWSIFFMSSVKCVSHGVNYFLKYLTKLLPNFSMWWSWPHSLAHLILHCFKLAPKTFITIFVHFHSMQMCHTLNNHYTLKQLFIVLYIVLLGNPPMHCKFFVLLQKLTFLLIYYDNNIWIKDN